MLKRVRVLFLEVTAQWKLFSLSGVFAELYTQLEIRAGYGEKVEEHETNFALI